MGLTCVKVFLIVLHLEKTTLKPNQDAWWHRMQLVGLKNGMVRSGGTLFWLEGSFW